MLKNVDLRNCILIVLGFALPIIPLYPFQNVPFRDDWTYAWSVENLLKTGALRILDWSTSIDVAQILWGALFSLPGGFSFSALRVSTWVLSVIGLVGLYLFLRELDVSPTDSLIGAATLAVCPLYFLLSYSFMTDAPAMTFTTWALYFFAKALKLTDVRWLIGASVFSVLTIATRLTGIALPAAVGATLLFHKNERVRKIPAITLGVVIPIVFGMALLYWHTHHVEYRADLRWLEGSPANRTGNLKYGVLLFPRFLLLTLTYVMPPLGILLGALALGCWKWNRYRKVLLVLGVALFFVGLGALTGVTSRTGHGATWQDLIDMGGSYDLVPGASYEPVSTARNIIAGALGILLFAIAMSATASKAVDLRTAFLRWFLVFQFGIIVLLWLWPSRYLIPFLPALIALMLTGSPVRYRGLAVACIAVSAIVSVGVLHDELAYNRALWLGVQDLQRRGVPPSKMDGGYVVNGWFQYAHRENAKRNANGDVQVDSVNVLTNDSDFRLSNAAEPGLMVLNQFSYGSWFGRSGRIYVLRRDTAQVTIAR